MTFEFNLIAWFIYYNMTLSTEEQMDVNKFNVKPFLRTQLALSI